ncbi:hypothetical protein [Cytobacillus dafuensis]|uniref:Uncharacterized protein n=1 Tax=Cytobacillus dafuensis TaxID=1742359 RepID=A0A5B8Z7T1_CYTDA|nr:hypothetical protein [Cytobacillus dafuensis]QED49030.1 hypothetical protein FSZ17_18115 [Cytobacillus dafuensis]
MSEIPPFHPEWLVSFWLGTPILNTINPHFVLIVLIAVLIFKLIKRRKNTHEHDYEEMQFQLLLKKKAVIEEQMTELERNKKLGEVTDLQYSKIIEEYKQHLDTVKKELLRFTQERVG